MNDKKRYYWIKLKTDFFESAEIDFLMAQPDGCKYVVLYQMLCLQTANQEGKLGIRFGEKIIPYDTQKIVRDTKYFDEKFVREALELFKKFNLVFENEECLEISNFEDMVGSETNGAKRKREQRKTSKNEKLVLDNQEIGTNSETSIGTDIGTEIATKGGTILGHCPTEIDIEKEIEIEIDKDIDIDIELEKEKRKEEEKEEESGKVEFFENKIAVTIHILDVIAKARSPCWGYAN